MGLHKEVLQELQTFRILISTSTKFRLTNKFKITLKKLINLIEKIVLLKKILKMILWKCSSNLKKVNIKIVVYNQKNLQREAQ